jgi:hypothetical protein
MPVWILLNKYTPTDLIELVGRVLDVDEILVSFENSDKNIFVWVQLNLVEVLLGSRGVDT